MFYVAPDGALAARLGSLDLSRFPRLAPWALLCRCSAATTGRATGDIGFGLRDKAWELNSKSEVRNPKAERNPKPEVRISERYLEVNNSEFGFRISFGFRASEFGFRLAALNGSFAIGSRILDFRFQISD